MTNQWRLYITLIFHCNFDIFFPIFNVYFEGNTLKYHKYNFQISLFNADLRGVDAVGPHAGVQAGVVPLPGPEARGHPDTVQTPGAVDELSPGSTVISAKQSIIP